jgi:hypothetical protein
VGWAQAEEERKKQEDDEMTLRKETVIMRGNGVDPPTVQKVCVKGRGVLGELGPIGRLCLPAVVVRQR